VYPPIQSGYYDSCAGDALGVQFPRALFEHLLLPTVLRAWECDGHDLLTALSSATASRCGRVLLDSTLCHHIGARIISNQQMEQALISGESPKRVIVVSNRLPYTLKRMGGDSWRTEKSSGGLATALNPILKETNGLWIGWTGDVSGVINEKQKNVLARWARRDRYIAVNLPPDTARGFYEGYSNGTLWPLFHNFPSLLRFDPDQWAAYVRANEIFRDVILEHYRPGDLIWIHDYHLMLLPQLLREAVPDAGIGFFLHIPFPSSSVFRILPKREELLRGLLGADYLAFHTYRYLQHFRGSMLRLLGIGSEMERVAYGSRTVRLEALPIGIAPKEFRDLLENDKVTRNRLAELKERFKCCKIILGVDRLDYTKGIPERLRAFARLLAKWPEWRGRVVLIQVAVPSREHVDGYRQLRKEVDELVGRINGEWSTPDWSPVIYLRRSLPQAELAALYAVADVGLITALRDGLNLVAKEYIASKPDGDGVLVLSEFAGAAAEMGEAILINPYDEERTAEAVNRALSLSLPQRQERMSALYRRVEKNNVFAWGNRFVSNLNDSVRERAARSIGEGELLSIDAVTDAFRQSRSRLLLLDYDGTLVTYAKLPQNARPTPELIRVLEGLARDPKSTVAIVSGRSRSDLERWFKDIPDLWLAAEHGAIIFSPESKEWEQRHPGPSPRWKQSIYPVLDHYVERMPGSFIEEKEFSLVWHYRMSDPDFGDWLANELVANLEELLAETHFRAVKGQKTVEVKLVWTNKGEVLTQLKHLQPEPDFILAAGDDVTDEDLFARLPDSAWTIHVGESHSGARYRLSYPDQIGELLRRLAEVEDNDLEEMGEVSDPDSSIHLSSTSASVSC
jgi:trehalose 6-phosphate synthase/phosphatase